MPTRAQLENRLLELDAEEASQTYLKNRPWERNNIMVGGALPNSQGSYPWELQAEAEAAARFKNPRAGGLDSAQNVFAQLPNAFGPGRMTPPGTSSVARAPVSRNVGGNLVEQNPLTGAWTTVFSPPDKTDEKRTALMFSDLLRRRNTLLGKSFRTSEEDALLVELEREISASPAASTQPSPAVIESPARRPIGRGFIGRPESDPFGGFPSSGTNAFQRGFESVMGGEPAKTKRYKFNVSTGELE